MVPGSAKVVVIGLEAILTITQFSQNDPKWKSTLLGFDKSSTIGGYGCLLTSLAMVASDYGATGLTPAALNDKMKAAGGFEQGTAYLIGGLIGSVVPGMSVEYHPAHGVPAPLSEIDAALAEGQPVIIEVDWSPNPGLQTHYMVVYAKDGNDYLVYDPYPYPSAGSPMKLSQSKYATVAGSKDPAEIITGVFFTHGGGGAPPPAPPPLDQGVHASFPVYTQVDDLAVRSKPIIADGTLIKRFPANTELKVLEADAATDAKLGQQDQWLAIEAPDGTQGYTAAWLVGKTPPPAATPPVTVTVPPAPAGAPATAPVVQTTADQLKLRSRPDFTDATVLKMYPIGTILWALEPPDDVKRKVGTVYQWLQVIDATGKKGVVAAWYLTLINPAVSGRPAPAVPV
jgi:hypothetical protein